MTYIVPKQIQAAKAVTIRGVSYAKDQVLTAAQIKAIPKLGALLSKNVLYTTPDVHSRRMRKRRPSPTNVPPKVLATVTATPDFAIAASAAEKVVTLTITGGDGPYTIAWGDSSSSTVKGKSSTHTYATADTFTITATGQNTDTATTTVTTT